MIELINVSFSYKGKTALEDINIKINEGEAVALIGPNGSGKSTLMKLINGIISPNKGEYLLDKKIITEKQLNNNIFSKAFHKKIGFVFQNSDTQLFCSTVYEEIAFGPRQMGILEEEVKKRVYDCLRLLNIEKLKHEAPYNLSEGEKKRVAIASVLSMNPEILTLDEPMNGIDPKGKKFLKELLLKLNASGKTIICSTHDFDYVEGIFKRAIVFSEKHRIIRDEDYGTVIKDEKFLIENNIK
ncbi:energy-coupling factor transporter ATP-binding protein EcfA2 [Clostridium homopropionicum DSM 5847]|uniref:Energy-coupling factor transporter ATP-binding protein EcfA2 n=1 Tax=Clostridium homopropionicum DSM 5847 TaxID=1121318 RepID=A0A0L6ZEK4_9CLOT|nr:ABC transporter ATP-binding protein [Clostridium homopropionicum]KOA21406.1 energy-coupling factor transporter ATP-binding protein EcfA2 [Clostridium homopropionicum DSM 5847]SFG10920.1 cobalt/nickel transport system ATP-binding protein [Clostridium homopropionicum]